MAIKGSLSLFKESTRPATINAPPVQEFQELMKNFRGPAILGQLNSGPLNLSLLAR
jgi:hypothetical protein